MPALDTMLHSQLFNQVLLSAAILAGGTLGGFILCYLMGSFADRRHIKRRRTLYLQKFVRYSLGVAIVLLICLVWGINLSAAWVVLTSLFGIIGIALFAQWSILSNVTCCFILFFSAPFKIDDFVTVKDGDNSVTGQVADMTLFYVRLLTGEGELVNIPNNLIVQKTVFTHRQGTTAQQNPG
ncbi:hypothetical protein DESUT3_12710 [Desulfuromonas versatilis]|uniref:Mechanosensitive ion channel MscS domain-containing protein n=2 Tax=Desulfuromonas versatilis TaxID=2802975 RepID=A0ABN6DVT5_9BACT|nr:hypothetical protein DESUT3_12710 [Desulfuromonas versatilis]